MLPSLLISIPEGVIDLGWGHPSPHLHPTDMLRRATEIALARWHTHPAPVRRYPGLRPPAPLPCRVPHPPRTPTHPPCRSDELFLTAGASQAIDHATTLFTQTGDTVFVEEPTYYLIQSIFEDHGLNVVGVPTDANGLRTDALEAMLDSPGTCHARKCSTSSPPTRTPAAASFPPTAAASSSNSPNSTNSSILADEVYQPPPLRPNHHHHQSPPSTTSNDGCAISLGSFSKILASRPPHRLAPRLAHPSFSASPTRA